jgi:queuine tRNA-ribosyltransferase
MPLEMATNSSGFWTLREPILREQMHPLGNPFQEGLCLYVRPCAVEERLRFQETAPLVVWDVGLGMGANAAALLSTARGCFGAGTRKLELHSFENAPEGFRCAVEHPDRFPYLNDAIFSAILKSWVYDDEMISWKVHVGDFFDQLANAPAPEVIFYDPFSRGVNPLFWSEESFRRLFEITEDKAAVLATYANARTVRQMMTNGGWRVAVGPGFGNRNQTTLAVNEKERVRRASYLWWNAPKA